MTYALDQFLSFPAAPKETEEKPKKSNGSKSPPKAPAGEGAGGAGGVFDAAKSFDIHRVITELCGVKTHSEGARVYCACPVHKGKNTSQMVVGGDRNVATCFGDCSGCAYTTIDIVLAHFGLSSAKEAAEKICEHFKLTPTAETATWQSRLKRTEKGALLGEVSNVQTILTHDPRWAGVLRWNEFKLTIDKVTDPPWFPDDRPPGPLTGEWTDSDTTRVRAWLSRKYSAQVGGDIAFSTVKTVAECKPYHPVRGYLRSVQWDGVERIDTWLSTYLGAATTEYTKKIGRWFLISAVARIMQPGCKVDTMPILEGEQGKKKSTAIKTLFSPAWFSDTPIDLNSKDRFTDLQGIWCSEWSELDSLSRADLGRVKNFTSSAEDKFRLSDRFGGCATGHAPRSSG